MNKQSPTAQRRDRQAGFTLIELIAVIVILGILAATALPKFSSLSGDARYASLKAAQGALLSVSAMTHGQFMINGQATQKMEDVTVTMLNGYPKAIQTTADAAGLTGDYTVYSSVSGPTATVPNVYAGSMSIVPNNIAGTAKAINCFLIYESATTTTPPVVRVGGNTTAANCV